VIDELQIAVEVLALETQAENVMRILIAGLIA
jgi:hypothetical protein